MDVHLVLATCVLVFAPQLCQGADWSYTGTHGTDHWPTDFMSCSGSRQSPIDLDNGEASLDDHLKPFSFEGFEPHTHTWNIVNNGHTVQINFVNETAIVSDGSLPDKYIVRQLHFHWGEDDGQGSEHTVDGMAYPMEVHIVTYKSSYGNIVNSLQHSDGLAVLGFFFEIGSTHNTPFQNIVNALQHVKNPEDTYAMPSFNLLSLIPDDREYYRYLGGLTTPPCSEVVIWTVFRTPIQVSAEQVAAFRDLLYVDHSSHASLPLTNNYRPVQDLSGRKITTTFEPPNSSTSSLVGSLGSIIMSLITAALARL
ncbi:carbonic anhydrase 2-like [Pomacea canaliculata]|uniref:carbonic anhydrase 2-like n=1 Tax=Pomacea canaliculata TaxID=400727 RepID=UPI000D739555|nr:carbonic anhydrase 2-like [Pomacea canaliculata]